MSDQMLVDRYNRHLTYLRLSVTDRCNLRCVYCVPADRIRRLSHEDILRYEEILRIVGIGVSLGITKVRVTGGEPLVRKGVLDFLKALHALPALSEVTLTTNGVLLTEYIEAIQKAGVARINISLDTLQREKFENITGRDAFDQVWAGIQSALRRHFHPVKINVVALRGINEDELLDFARLTVDSPLHVRFIEYMPIGKSRMQFGPPLLVPEIKERLRSLGELKPVASSGAAGPAEQFQLAGAAGEIGFISALSHHFCSTCNRLRLTASGQLRPCLLSDQQLDLRGPLRAGASDAEVAEIFRRAVRCKPSDHNLTANEPSGVSCQMSSLGG